MDFWSVSEYMKSSFMEQCWDFMQSSLKAWKSRDVLFSWLVLWEFSRFQWFCRPFVPYVILGGEVIIWLLNVHIELNFCPDYITLMELWPHNLDWREKDVARTDIHTVKVSSLVQRRGDKPPGGGLAVAARSACYHLLPANCFLYLLHCYPGGCSPSWAENPLRLVSTRNSHACHPLHCSHAEDPAICPPVPLPPRIQGWFFLFFIFFFPPAQRCWCVPWARCTTCTFLRWVLLNPSQDLCPRYLHNGAFLLPHVYRFAYLSREDMRLTPRLHMTCNCHRKTFPWTLLLGGCWMPDSIFGPHDSFSTVGYKGLRFHDEVCGGGYVASCDTLFKPCSLSCKKSGLVTELDSTKVGSGSVLNLNGWGINP